MANTVVTLHELNSMPAGEAADALLSCCGSMTWARVMAERRPFPDLDELMKAAEDVWGDLSRDDWIEAFSAHPRIGNVEARGSRFVHTRKWASDEQSRVSSASQTVLSLLAEGNRRYEDRFGYIFIVSAAGKSAAQMLRLLKERLKNDPSDEIRIASAEQRKITALRLEKMIEEPSTDG